MKVSIVVPTYNVTDRLLLACLDSLEKQTFRPDDIEIILVDDCSTESRTIEIIDEFVARVGHARLERHTDNRGLNEARRTGVNAAQGDYVVFVDGDDILTRDAAEALYLAGVKADADIVTAPLLRWYPERVGYDRLAIAAKPLPADRLDRVRAVLSGSHSFTMCGRAFRRSLLDDEIFEMPEGTLHEDLVTTARLAFAARSVSHVAQPLYYYTANSSSITHVFTSRHIDGFVYALTDWIRLTQRDGIFDELEPSIQQGAEKFMNTCVERNVFRESTDLGERMALLEQTNRGYDGLAIRRPEPAFDGTRLLVALASSSDPEMLVKEFVHEHRDEYVEQRAPSRTAEPKFTLEPSDVALLTKDKIVFICQVDYQLRNAARLARELRKRGHACAVLDNSRFTAGGKRQLDPSEGKIFWRTNRIVIEQPPYGVDWLSSAKLVVVFNDFNNDFREALEFRHRLGLPSVCMVEGINDFLRVDFDEPRQLPYRRCDYVFLAGEQDARYFTDRPTVVAGLPGIEELTSLRVSFPDRPLAALNVNFTYGCLEDRRDEFVEQARAGIAKAGFELAITQHPMDKADLAGLPVSSKTQYELIDDCSVFVSRFATGILEALASGKPAVYFNPHGERVDKFNDPMGAFEIATSADELAAALLRVRTDIDAGVDFRDRASDFLRHHAAIGLDGMPVVERFALAAIEIVERHTSEQQSAASLLVERTAGAALVAWTDDGVVIGNFERDHHAQINEEEIIGRYLGTRFGLMIDVGANFGNSLDIYLGKGWVVHAFEPDPANRKRLFESFPSQRRLVVNDLAVSDRAGDKLPFFSSEESTGISSLAAFTDDHRQVATVTTTTLDDYLAEWKIDHVDFLKIDVEGYDKFVLDGFPWDRDRPDVVLAEFEDSKTEPLGYTFDDMAEQLLELGYSVYISVWHPIVRYGIAHDWRSLERYRPGMELSDTWGNLIGFREAPDEEQLYDLVERSMKFSPKWEVAPAAKPQAKKTERAAASALRPWYADRADRLRDRNPGVYRRLRQLRRGLSGTAATTSGDGPRRSKPLFRVGQLASWTLRAARRHAALSAGLSLLFAAGLITALTADADGWITAGWIAAGVAAGLGVLLAAGAVLREAFRRLDRHRERKLRTAIKSVRRDIKAVDNSVAQLSFTTETVARSVAQSEVKLDHRIAALEQDRVHRSELDEHGRQIEAAENSIADSATKLAAFDARVERLQSDVRAAAAAATTAKEGPPAIESGLPRSTPLPAVPVVEPLVSVIVTCFDEAEYLRTCLTSIEIQDLDTFECVIVDDGSGDASPEIAAEFVDRDRRFRLLRHAERLGPSAGRNTGLAAARGRFGTFMDADDFMYQGSLSRRLATAWDLDGACAGSYCDWTMVEVDAVPTVEERHPLARQRIDFVGSDGENPFIVTAPLIRIAVARAVGGFNESMTVAEDFEFWIRVLRHGYHFEPVSHVGVAYRQKPEGNVRPVLSQHVEMAEEIYRYLDRELAPPEFGHVDQPIFNRPLATYRRELQFSRRLVTFLALATLRDNSADIASISARLPASIDMLPYARLDVETRVRGAAARFAWQDRSQPSAELAGLQFRVREQLERIRADRRQLRLSQQPHDDARSARPAAGGRDGVGMPTWLADEWDGVADRATAYVPDDQ